MAAALVRLHDLQPLAQIARETRAGRRVDSGARRLAQHDQRAARRRAPALLRCADQDIHAVGDHVDPDRARSDAIEHEQAADGVHGIGDGTQIGVGKDHARRCFDVGREHHGRPLLPDGRDDVVDGRWRKWSLPALADSTRLEHDGLRRNGAHVEYLAPPKTEPPIANDEAFPSRGELTRDGFHSEGSAARHHDRRSRVVDAFQSCRDVPDGTLEGLGHVIERAIREDHGIFEQPLRVDIGQQARHGQLRKWEGG